MCVLCGDDTAVYVCCVVTILQCMCVVLCGDDTAVCVCCVVTILQCVCVVW